MRTSNESLVGGARIYTEANHFDGEDFHPQYVSKKHWTKIQGKADMTDPFYRLVILRLLLNDSAIAYGGELFISTIYHPVQYCKFLARMRIAGSAESGTKTCDLTALETAGGFDKSLLTGEKIDAGANGLTLVLRLEVDAAYKDWQFRPTMIVPSREPKIYGIEYNNNVWDHESHANVFMT